ncbi:MAG: hypothetical protein IKZ49_04380 [Alphaproteobacteria bacterium]|nr:hypothetical protein [Alphaproteobacteria bacterium]
MRKVKIILTIFLLYEFLIISVLQIPAYCESVFNNNFCLMGNYKYWLMCIILPVSAGLFIWWVPDIAKLFCKNTCEIQNNKPNNDIKDILHEIVSAKDIERLITAAIIMGIQKFATNHPETKETFDNILDVIKRVKQ